MTLVLDEERAAELAEIFRLLGDANRLRIAVVEPRRDFRRPQLLRDWSHDEAYPTLFP